MVRSQEGISPEILHGEWTEDKNTPIHHDAHYSDRRFKQERTVFGRNLEGLSYEYSDRIYQYDREKARKAASDTKNAGFTPCTASWYEKWISLCFDRKLELCHIIAGVNRSDGYPYLVFGYKKLD